MSSSSMELETLEWVQYGTHKTIKPPQTSVHVSFPIQNSTYPELVMSKDKDKFIFEIFLKVFNKSFS